MENGLKTYTKPHTKVKKRIKTYEKMVWKTYNKPQTMYIKRIKYKIQ